MGTLQVDFNMSLQGVGDVTQRKRELTVVVEGRKLSGHDAMYIVGISKTLLSLV